MSAVAAAAVPLAACANGDTAAPPATTSTTVGGTITIPEQVPNQVRLRSDVQIVACHATPDGWSAGGTVENSQGRSVTYHITIFFTSAGATDLAFAATSVPVSAGQTRHWSVAASFMAPSAVLCVLRGVSAG